MRRGGAEDSRGVQHIWLQSHGWSVVRRPPWFTELRGNADATAGAREGRTGSVEPVTDQQREVVRGESWWRRDLLPWPVTKPSIFEGIDESEHLIKDQENA